MNTQNKYRYYNFVIRRNFKTDKYEFEKGQKFTAIVASFVSDGIELFSFSTKDDDKLFVIPCEFVKFAED